MILHTPGNLQDKGEQLYLCEIGVLMRSRLGGVWSDCRLCRALKDARFVRVKTTNCAVEASDLLQQRNDSLAL